MKTQSSVFYRPTHRDLAILLPRLTRRSTRAPGHKGQIGTVLARKILDLTVRTTRLLLIACRSLQSDALSPTTGAPNTYIFFASCDTLNSQSSLFACQQVWACAAWL